MPTRERADGHARADLRVCFVHTPMSTVGVEQRRTYWQSFDARYHATHPRLRPMRWPMWELPHWMTWLGGVLQHDGYTHLSVADLYDMPVQGTDLDAGLVERRLRAAPADVYLFSPMTPNLHLALQIAEVVKSLNPRATTIFGGVVATPLGTDLVTHPAVDFVIRGRGERALTALLDHVLGLHPLNEVGNLCVALDAAEVWSSGFTHPEVHPEDLPFPKVDLFTPDTGKDLRYLRQVYALGCPYVCPFCTIQTIGKRPKYFPLQRVLDEIAAYRGHFGDHHTIYFGDETFTLHRDRTLALCAELEKVEDLDYDCQTRLNLVDDTDLLTALSRSGCRWLEIGIESVDQEAQNRFKQHVRLDNLREQLKRVRDHGIASCSFVVNGLPGQTPDAMRRSVDAIADLIDEGLLYASYLFGLVPYPGSEFFDTPEQFGLKIHHRDFALYHEDLPPVYSTTAANPDETYAAFLYGVETLDAAMARTAPFGDFRSGPEAAELGMFWAAAHV